MLATGGVATLILAGNVSVTSKPVAGTSAPELSMVKVIATAPFKVTLWDANDFVKTGTGRR